MDQLAMDLLPWARAGVIITFVSLAVVATVRAPRTGRAGWWIAAAFEVIAVAMAGIWLPDIFEVELPDGLSDAMVVLVLAFPYLLLRFTASFRDLPRWMEVAAATSLAVTVAATLAILMPSDPAGTLTPWLGAYLVAIIAHFVWLSLVTVVLLWRAGRGQPTVARRRMRLMSAATAVLALTVLLAAQPVVSDPAVGLLADLGALTSAIVFGFGFSPPRLVRLSWRRPEEEQLQAATTAVLLAGTARDVTDGMLPPTMRLVGGGGAAVVDADGRVVAAHGLAPELGTELDGVTVQTGNAVAREVVPLGDRHGSLVVWTSPYSPFFGREEAGLLRSMAAVVTLALERCDLLEEERARRAALERANREAEQARDEASRANLAKSEFLSRMSHELRTPLNAILGFGQLLETTPLGDEDRESVGHIIKAGGHLLELINDVLDLSRIEAGTLAISLEPVHAGELIQDALALIRPLAASRSIRLVTNDGGCDVYVTTDRQRCRQVLLNLLSNGVKYNHDGGEVEVCCAPVGDDSIRVSVRDTGPGIKPARLDQLFEPFERLGAEATSVEGTGLGLALTKQLVERLGGTIGVETSPGEGSTFWIDMPRTDAPPAIAEPVARRQAARETSEHTLLLIEDNLANLRLVEAMLRRRPGISVLPAMQGGLALELAYEHQPDVIVLDLHLPDIPGRDVLYRLQADPRTRDIPVIIASADATPGRVRQLREEGAFEYITKPLDLQRFLDLVDAALTHRNGAHDLTEL